jgi:hypothetical protein
MALSPQARSSADAAAALAVAPPLEASSGAPVTAPAPVVLPPSARLVAALTPTPNVVASSPALAPGAPVVAGIDYARAIKLVQDTRKSASTPRLEERIEATVVRARGSGSEIEVLGWQAALKGSTNLYQVTFMLRQDRQGVRAEWEANLATGEVRAVNSFAESLEAS